jgi:peptide/nickel transport system ATP-binding protein
MVEPLVRARELNVKFAQGNRTNGASGGRSFVHAVNGVDFDLQEREVLCILGESGSGKSVTLRALMRLNPPSRTVMSGTLEVGGHDVVAASEAQMSALRGAFVSMIFQDPMTSLDPVFTVGQQITETILRHERIDRSEARERALNLLELVQIPSAKRRLDAYPHELSGGLRQRAMIAIALSCRPKLLLADEPTTALDASVQIQILFLLREIQQEMGMGMIFVTHDLGVAGEIADRIAVMYAGRFIEEGPVDDLMRAPLHPYARGLLGATVHEGSRGSRLVTIPGAPPDLRHLPDACAFAPRCSEAENLCLEGLPGLRRPSAGRAARCVHVTDRADMAPAVAAGECATPEFSR